MGAASAQAQAEVLASLSPKACATGRPLRAVPACAGAAFAADRLSAEIVARPVASTKSCMGGGGR